MNFAFTDSQRQIADSAEAFLRDASSMAKVRAAMENGYDPELWGSIREQMYWHLTHVPEDCGGLGLGYVELCILLEAMGKHLVCAPFYSSVALGVNALLVQGSKDQQERLFGRLEQGATLTLAWSGASRAWGLAAISAEYEPGDNGGVVLTGTCSQVIDGDTADVLIVIARRAGGGQDDLSLFIVPGDAVGITKERTPSLDQTRKLTKIRFDDVLVPAANIMTGDGDAPQAIEAILALAAISLAAEQLGVADRALAMTLTYITERRQFGRLVGSFQAMKHKAADMLVRAEAARSAVYYAACIADEYLNDRPLGTELLEAASIAKSYSCEAAFFNAGSALQMHGGMGFTWEADVHLFFKRAKAAQVALGDESWHKSRLAEMVLGALAMKVEL